MGFDEDCSSVITLSTEYVLITRQLAKDLALVCFMRQEHSHTGVIQYNLEVFREHMQQMFTACHPTQPSTHMKGTN